jgi:hypothetical protein
MLAVGLSLYGAGAHFKSAADAVGMSENGRNDRKVE